MVQLPIGKVLLPGYVSLLNLPLLTESTLVVCLPVLLAMLSNLEATISLQTLNTELLPFL